MIAVKGPKEHQLVRNGKERGTWDLGGRRTRVWFHAIEERMFPTKKKEH
jgi:hypothetical protein